MTTASICTIGDEILIGQIVDTNSSAISRMLGESGISVKHMISIGDNHDEIVRSLNEELSKYDIVIVTGGLGPTKDDITKKCLFEISGSSVYLNNAQQEELNTEMLRSRGLNMLESNRRQSMVPDKCKVIPNKFGTAPIMSFHWDEKERFSRAVSLYSMPGVPHEALGMLPYVIDDIRRRFEMQDIIHRNIMLYGIAESALSEKISAWEDALPHDMHLAYLPNMLTGIRLRLDTFASGEDGERRSEEKIGELKSILGELVYSDCDDTLESSIGRLLRSSGRTLSVAESCTGGEIAHLITTVPGSSEYFLGSVTSYAIPIKRKILGVGADIIEKCGIVSSEVAAAMAEGVRHLMGSTYSVATTGWADAYGDEHEPAGTVWVAVSGPAGTLTQRFQYKNGRRQNIQRFAASALNMLRLYIGKD